MNKKILVQQEFKAEGDFVSMYLAHAWLKERGYDYGSTSATFPVAVMKGDYNDYDLPWKWKNFTAKQMNMVHGTITGNMRNGPVVVTLYDIYND